MAPRASYSITMRVHLGADPLGIGRITTAVGEAAGTVVAVDIVESHPDSLVVDLTCNELLDQVRQGATAVGAPNLVGEADELAAVIVSASR
jgi:malate dehydrogenase (oxaloacetate-decarboxylating)